MAIHYQITVAGHLDPAWSAWFDGLAITYQPNGDTTLAGPVADQAALYGVLKKARDLGLTLLAVKRTEWDTPPALPKGRPCSAPHPHRDERGDEGEGR